MARNAAVFVNTGVTDINFIGSQVMGQTQTWHGGRGTLVISANTWGGTVFLATQTGNGTWVNINGTTYSANQVTAYDLPPGQYRMINGGSSTLNLSAILVPISYLG